MAFGGKINDVIKIGTELEIVLTEPLSGGLTDHRLIGTVRLKDGQIIRTYMGNSKTIMYGGACVMAFFAFMTGLVLNVFVSFLIDLQGPVGYLVIPVLAMIGIPIITTRTQRKAMAAIKHQWV